MLWLKLFLRQSNTNGYNRFKFTLYSQLYESINGYIYGCNNERLHFSLGSLAPLEMEIKLRGIIKKVA